MKLTFFTVAIISITFCSKALAQEIKKDTAAKQTKTITIRKKVSDNNQKMTIVVDGDKITINGKPVEEMKDSDIQVIKGNARNLALMMAPQIQGMKKMMPMKTPKSNIIINGNEWPMNSGNKAVLGVTTQKDDKGAKINDVAKESAAAKAGLQKDDIISKVGDTKIESSEDLYAAIGKYNPDDKVKITYWRDGKENTTTATLLKSKEITVFDFKNDGDFNFQEPKILLDQAQRGFSFSSPRRPKLGLQIQDLETGNGVKVLDIDEDTPAAKSGLKKNDVITEINGKELKNVDDLREKVKDVKEGDTVQLKFKRDGKTQTAEIKFPKKLKTADL
jgi:serine protease Do